MPSPIQRFQRGRIGELDFTDWNQVADACEQFTTLHPQLTGSAPGVKTSLFSEGLAIVQSVEPNPQPPIGEPATPPVPPQHAWIEAEWNYAQRRIVIKPTLQNGPYVVEPRSSFGSGGAPYDFPAYTIDGSIIEPDTPVWLYSMRMNTGKELYLIVPYVNSTVEAYSITGNQVINATVSNYYWRYTALPTIWNQTSERLGIVPTGDPITLYNTVEMQNTNTFVHPGVNLQTPGFPAGIRPLPISNNTLVIAHPIVGTGTPDVRYKFTLSNAWSTSCT